MRLRAFLAVCVLAAAASALKPVEADTVQRNGRAIGNDRRSDASPRVLKARHERIRSITILQEAGVRPHFSPDGQLLVFDRKDASGFYNVYISDLQGRIVKSLTKGNPGITQRNNGNARFDHSGRFIIFISEEPDHFGESIKALGDSGIGLFSNVWATDLDGSRFWKLTDIPIKKKLLDRIPAMASVNPVVSRDGRTLVWTERYAEGGNNRWGRWRLKAGEFVIDGDRPVLRSPRVLYTPKRGTYVTGMAFLDNRRMVVAGNLDGQHEYGMDQYVLDLNSQDVRNLTRSPDHWDEDSSLAPDGSIVFMSNSASRYKFNFRRGDWASQPVERDYYITDAGGRRIERLTHFNDPDAPEYLGNRVLVAASHMSPDGRYLAGTIGVDQGKGDRRENVQLKVILIEFTRPLR